MSKFVKSEKDDTIENILVGALTNLMKDFPSLHHTL